MSEQSDQNLLDGVCLSAGSAATHEACTAGDGTGCMAGELCMMPVLAKDEHLYKVCTCPWCPYMPVPRRWARDAGCDTTWIAWCLYHGVVHQTAKVCGCFQRGRVACRLDIEGTLCIQQSPNPGQGQWPGMGRVRLLTWHVYMGQHKAS